MSPVRLRAALIGAGALAATLVAGAGAAQAVVVDLGSIGAGTSAGAGQPYTVPFNAANAGNYIGLQLVPAQAELQALWSLTVPTVATSAPCTDPALTPEFTLQSTALCSHGGNVLHAAETFAMAWDPPPYSAFSAGYVEQFLRDVADNSASGAMTSPYNVTAQYTDATGRAAHSELFGGGYHDVTAYPTNGCVPAPADHANAVCLTDAQLRSELTALVHANGLIGKTQPGHTPMMILMTPKNVAVCLNAAGTICSANSTGIAQFCSYHSQITIDGQTLPYVVQPFTALTNCDEPDAPAIPPNPDPLTLANLLGARLVSPISQAQIAGIINPWMNGWFATDGTESSDHGCMPLANNLDTFGIGSGVYQLRREYNNGASILFSPATYGCAPSVVLSASFVVPSPIDAGEALQFDGSRSLSTLVVPYAEYKWDFGDGTTAVGPSVVHSYAQAGSYTAKLTVTDRGGYTSSTTQTVQVLTTSGQVAPPGSTPGGSNPTPTPAPPATPSPLHVSLQLVPQSLRATLNNGLTVRVSANEPADGIATLLIPTSAARKAGLRTTRSATTTIGTGTVSGLKDGTVSLRLHVARATGAKLRKLAHLTITVRLSLTGADHGRLTISAAGRY